MSELLKAPTTPGLLFGASKMGTAHPESYQVKWRMVEAGFSVSPTEDAISDLIIENHGHLLYCAIVGMFQNVSIIHSEDLLKFILDKADYNLMIEDIAVSGNPLPDFVFHNLLAKFSRTADNPWTMAEVNDYLVTECASSSKISFEEACQLARLSNPKIRESLLVNKTFNEDQRIMIALL